MSGTAATATIGLGRQTDWEVGVAPTDFFPCNESFSVDTPEIEVDVPYGGIDLPEPDRGRPSYGGGLGSILAKPGLIGHIFTAALNIPVTTGAAAPYVHTFTPRTAPKSSTVALEPYSIQISAGTTVERFSGCQLTDWTLNAPPDGRVTFDTDWIARSWEQGVADATPVIETAKTYTFIHAAHTKGGVAFPTIKNLTLGGSTEIEMDMTQDGTDNLRATYLGTRRLTANFTVPAYELALWNEFIADTDDAWVFQWSLASGEYLKISIPNLKVVTLPRAPASGRGIIERSISARAASKGSGLYSVEIGNNVATY